MSVLLGNILAEIIPIEADLSAEDHANVDFKHEFTSIYPNMDEVSPIELRMAVHLLYAMRHPDHFGTKHLRNKFLPMVPDARLSDIPVRKSPGFTVVPQLHIGDYIADFAIVALARKGVLVRGAVECDGHDFHEKTKEQAKHDRSRDRYFQSCGLIILRYTGSEIFADSLHCANDALKTFERRSSAE